MLTFEIFTLLRSLVVQL